MKAKGILNVELAKLIAKAGHGDMIVIVDRGFPFPVSDHTMCIDLAIGENLPKVSQVLDIVLDELIIEKTIMAEETLQSSRAFYDEIKEVIAKRSDDVEEQFVPHAGYKESILAGGFKSKEIIGYVRTGEFTKYANIVLVAGVGF